MNCLIVGLGSMGKRRARLLREHFSDIAVVGVDSDPGRCRDAEEQLGIKTCPSLDMALAANTFTHGVVSTAPLSHAEIIGRLLEAGLHVFTELNLVSDRYVENTRLAEEKGLVLFLSSTFIYRQEIDRIIRSIHQADHPMHYTYHVGQYLPDWHPWESIENFFVSDRRTNGCREIFAVEMPWLLRAFGPVADMQVVRRKLSRIPLDYPDTYLVTLEHQRGHIGQLAVDVVSRVPVRHFEVFGEDFQMEWRGTPEALFEAEEPYDSMRRIPVELASRQEGYRSFIVEDAYLKELQSFFSICRGQGQYNYTFQEDMVALGLIDRIEGIRG